ncbi:MAG TPA: hypothetical protein VKV40_13730 [Ktedonobacteraceae bacterium]|nr:hypothetical protein [Ktedonobacteraceae bacterium]
MRATVYHGPRDMRIDQVPDPAIQTPTEWYKNVRQNPTISLTQRGKTLTARAHIITCQERLEQILDRFRDKYGRNVKSYYPKYNVAVAVPLS